MNLAMLSAVASSRDRRVAVPAAGGGGGPTWMASVVPSTLTWGEIPSSNISAVQSGFTQPGGWSATGLFAYSGASVKESGSELIVFGGGHSDGSGNEGYAIRLQDNTPVFRRLRNPTVSVAIDVDHFSDGRPNSRHTAWDMHFCNARNQVIFFGAFGKYGNGNGGNAVDAFDMATGDYITAATYSNANVADNVPKAVAKDASENIWCIRTDTGAMLRWNASDGTTTAIGTRNTYNYAAPLCHDPINNRLVRFSTTSGAKFDLNNNGAESSVTFGGPQAAKANENCSVIWCADRNSFLILPWGENNIYECNPTTFAVTSLSIAGTKPTAASGGTGDGLYGRFNYMPELGLVVFLRTNSTNVFCFRTR